MIMYSPDVGQDGVGARGNVCGCKGLVRTGQGQHKAIPALQSISQLQQISAVKRT